MPAAAAPTALVCGARAFDFGSFLAAPLAVFGVTPISSGDGASAGAANDGASAGLFTLPGAALAAAANAHEAYDLLKSFDFF